MKIKLTDEQIDSIIIKELKTQYLYSGDPEIARACGVLLSFYNVDPSKLKIKRKG